MGSLRNRLTQHRIWAIWLIAAALLMKIAVPPGYMPVPSAGFFVMQPCSGFGPEQMAMAMPDMPKHHGDMNHPGKDSVPCGFDGHAPPSLTMVDPILLALAIAFIVTLRSRLPLSWPIRRVTFLRPPLRGPPTIA